MVRTKETEKEYNVIYDDKVIKYTINIPIPLYSKITGNARRQRLDRSVVIRAILEKAFTDEKPITMAELLRREKSATEVICVDPPRKFHGFTGGLRRNSFVAGWFKRKAEQSRTAQSRKQY